MRKDFAHLARDIYATIADSVEWPALNETHEDYAARQSAGQVAAARARYIAQHIPAAGGPAFLQACGVRPHA